MGEPDLLRFSSLPAQSALPNVSTNIAQIPKFFILNSSFFIALPVISSGRKDGTAINRKSDIRSSESRDLSCPAACGIRAGRQISAASYAPTSCGPLSVSLWVSLASSIRFRRSHRLTALPMGEPDLLRFPSLPTESALPNVISHVTQIPQFLIPNS